MTLWSALIFILLTNVLVNQNCQAGSYFEKCHQKAQVAQRGCGPTDREAGMEDPEKIKQLMNDIKNYEDFVQKTAACGRIPAHFENQAAMASAVAQLSDAKAKACQTTYTQCQDQCVDAAKRDEAAAEVYNIIKLPDQAAEAQNQAQQSRRADSTCGGYQAQVSEFQNQAAKARQDEQASKVGLQKSMQENPVASGGPNPECASSQVAHSGASRPSSAMGGVGAPAASSRTNENLVSASQSLTQRPISSTSDSPGDSSHSLTQRGISSAVNSPTVTGSRGSIHRPADSAQVGGGAKSGASGRRSPASTPEDDEPPPSASLRAAMRHFRELAAVKGEINVQSARQQAVGPSIIGSQAMAVKPPPARAAGGYTPSSFPDGITPALGPTLFQKVSSQYRKQIPKLKMD